MSGSGLAGVAELDEQARKAVDERATRLTFDGEAVDFPEPAVYDRPIAFNVLPLAGSIVDDGLGRDRRGAEAPQRVPQDPGDPGAEGLRHLRARAGLLRPLAPGQRPLRAADQRRSARASCSAAAPGVELSDIPTPLQAAGKDAVLRRPHPRATRRSEHGLALFLSNDNLRKGAALNAVQIAELVAAE